MKRSIAIAFVLAALLWQIWPPQSAPTQVVATDVCNDVVVSTLGLP